MNVSALDSLSGRWPNDAMPATTVQAFKILAAAISDPGASQRAELVRFDPVDSQAIQQFAADNGFSYSQHTKTGLPSFDRKDYRHQPAWFGMWQNLSMPILTHEAAGQLYGFAVTFSLDYGQNNGRSNDGKNKRTQEDMMGARRSIIRVKLPAVFPQLVLDSHANDPGVSSSLNVAFETSQRISLEGDFDKYFDFFIPKGLQINALTVLAPNFMQLIIDSSRLFDVEFIGNELVFTSNSSIYDSAVMQQADTILRAQLGYLQTLLSSWHYEPQKQPFDLLERAFISGSVMRIGGHSIQPSTQLMFVGLFFVVIAILMLIF